MEAVSVAMCPPDRSADPIDNLRLTPLLAVSQPAFPLEHAYFETVYAPLLGPTAVLLARAMARRLNAAGRPTAVCPIELALEVGIRASSTDPLGKTSHLVRAISRLTHNHIVARIGDGVLGVRVAVPPLSAEALRRLPLVTVNAHQRFLADLTVSGRPTAGMPNRQNP